MSLASYVYSFIYIVGVILFVACWLFIRAKMVHYPLIADSMSIYLNQLIFVHVYML